MVNKFRQECLRHALGISLPERMAPLFSAMTVTVSDFHCSTAAQQVQQPTDEIKGKGKEKINEKVTDNI